MTDSNITRDRVTSPLADEEAMLGEGESDLELEPDPTSADGGGQPAVATSAQTARPGTAGGVGANGADGTLGTSTDRSDRAAGAAATPARGADTAPDTLTTADRLTTANTVSAPLFEDAGQLSARWQSVQVAFVDEPRRAVEDADHPVAEMMDRLNNLFRSQREDLEGAWNAGTDASTEDLRVALQRYRSFFERLLAA